MRRRVRNAYRLKAFFDGRVHQLRSGRSLDPFIDLGRLRVVVAFLVDSGIVRPSDWEMPSVPLASRGAAIDAMRSTFPDVVRSRVMDPSTDAHEVERRVLLSFAVMVSAVVIDMACVVFAHESSLASLVVHASKPRRIGDPFVPDLDAQVAKSALHSDPAAFLLDAIERRDAAVRDVSRAKRRISYLATEREDAVPKESLPPLSIDSAASLASISAIRGAANGALSSIRCVTTEQL